jgi:isoamylase
MTSEDWNTAHIRSVAVLLNGSAIREPDVRGEAVVDDSFFILFNGHYEPIEFALPDIGAGDRWTVEIDTTTAGQGGDAPTYATGAGLAVAGRSILVLSSTG